MILLRFVVGVFVLCKLKSHVLAIFTHVCVVVARSCCSRVLERMTCWLIMRPVTSAKLPECYTREREPSVARQPRANFNNRSAISDLITPTTDHDIILDAVWFPSTLLLHLFRQKIPFPSLQYLYRASLFIQYSSMTPSPAKTLIVLVAALASTDAFAPQNLRSTRCSSSSSSSQLSFGIPSFLTPQRDEDEDKDKDKNSGAKRDAKSKKGGKNLDKGPEKKIGLSGILQVIASGAGAPFLGDFEGVDKETGKFMFSLEANNLVDEKGNPRQTQMPYFENGWVDPEDEARAKEGFKFPWQK